MPETLRLFFAVPLPDEIRAAASELQQECACDELKIGWTRPQNMHFTLKFLGDTPESRVPKLAEVAACPAPPSGDGIEVRKLAATFLGRRVRYVSLAFEAREAGRLVLAEVDIWGK